jgi:hypothetical protein
MSINQADVSTVDHLRFFSLRFLLALYTITVYYSCTVKANTHTVYFQFAPVGHTRLLACGLLLCCGGSRKDRRSGTHFDSLAGGTGAEITSDGRDIVAR